MTSPYHMVLNKWTPSLLSVSGTPAFSCRTAVLQYFVYLVNGFDFPLPSPPILFSHLHTKSQQSIAAVCAVVTILFGYCTRAQAVSSFCLSVQKMGANKVGQTKSYSRSLCPQGLTTGRCFCTSTLGRSWWICSTQKFQMPTEEEE